MPNRAARRAKEQADRRKNKKLRAAAKTTSGLTLTAAATINAAAGEGAPRTFRIVAYTGEPMRLYGYEYPVVVDMATADLTAQAIPILYDHIAHSHYIVGQSSAVQANNGQIVVEGQFILAPGEDGDYARMVVAKADAGYNWQASVGGEPASVERVPAGQTITVNGRSYAGPVCVARGMRLREVSFVVLGGDRRTSAIVASEDKGTEMNFQEWLAALGFTDPTALNATQRTALEARYTAEMKAALGGTGTNTPPNPPPAPTTPPVQAGVDPVVQARNQVADELNRHARIQQLVAHYNQTTIEIGEGTQRQTVNAAEHAIRAGWDTRQLELELLRASRTAPAVINRSHDRDCTIQAMQGAMLLRAGVRLDDPHFATQHAVACNVPAWLRAGINDTNRNQYMEAAHRYGDMSLVDVCREACRLDGRDAPINRSELIRAAFSGGSLTNIFTSNVNTVVLLGFMEAADSTAGWTRETDVADFKVNERPRMTKGATPVKLPKGGTAQHLSRSDTGESYKIARYAHQNVVDEQDIIDDMFNALADTPREMGMGAARLRPDLVYAILLANPTLTQTSRALFNTTDGNLKTTHPLTAEKLKSAITAMKLFRENGVNLNLMPTHLLVPPSLHYTARELLNSTTIVIAGTAGSVTERGSANTLLGDITTLVSDARLENGLTDPDSGTAYSGSSTSWFMASNQGPTIEVAYRRGTGRAPQVRSFTLDRGQWGIGWDINLDIGVKALEWRTMLAATA